MCLVQPKIQKLPLITFHPHKAEYPTSVSSISPQSSLELDTDHGDMIDETIKHVTHTHNQPLKAKACKTNTNKDSSNPHDNTSGLQPTQDVNMHTTSRLQTQSKKTDTFKKHPPRDNVTSSIATFNQTKQIIIDIDKLSHSTTIWNKVLHAMNQNGLCKYHNSCQTYLNIQTNQSTALTY